MGAFFRYGAFNTEGARALLRYLTGPGRLRVVSFPLEDRREMRERVKSGARTKKSERGGRVFLCFLSRFDSRQSPGGKEETTRSLGPGVYCII